MKFSRTTKYSDKKSKIHHSKQWIGVFLKGCTLGFFILLPGISGGTVALIIGVYEKLIDEVSKFKIKYLKKVFPSSVKKNDSSSGILFFRQLWDWGFLAPLVCGILCSGVLFIIFAPPLIGRYSLEFYSIVFGLVLGSVLKSLQHIKKTKKTLFFFLFSFCLHLGLFFFDQRLSFVFEANVIAFLLAGFLSALALMIPGISGAYILILLGLYEKTLMVIREGDFLSIFFFILGAVTGVFSVAKIIKIVLRKYFDETLAVILGFVLSSLYPLFPLPEEGIGSFGFEQKIFFYYSFVAFFTVFVIHLLYKIKTRKTFSEPNK